MARSTTECAETIVGSMRSAIKVVQIDEAPVNSILYLRSWLCLYRRWLKVTALIKATIQTVGSYIEATIRTVVSHVEAAILTVVSQNLRVKLSWLRLLLLLLHLGPVLVHINCHVHTCKHICLLARMLLQTHHLGLKLSISRLLFLLKGRLKVVVSVLLLLILLLLIVLLRRKLLVRKRIKCWVLITSRGLLLGWIGSRVHAHDVWCIDTTLVVVKAVACLGSLGLLEIWKVIDRLHGVSILEIWKSIHQIVTGLWLGYHIKIDHISHCLRLSN